uniref:Uncharacterized protein n=1 Tax=Heterorhabditis bacteriophora TaxID=37862 RepID=A0A1I7WLB9_HETBA
MVRTTYNITSKCIYLINYYPYYFGLLSACRYFFLNGILLFFKITRHRCIVIYRLTKGKFVFYVYGIIASSVLNQVRSYNLQTKYFVYIKIDILYSRSSRLNLLHFVVLARLSSEFP